MSITVQYEDFSFKYRVRPTVPQEHTYFVYEQTFVKGYSFEISDPITGELWAQLRPSGMMFIYEGAPWDGPSGPAWDTPNFMDASLFHDYLYRAQELGKLPQSQRKKADKTMRAIAKKHGMWWPRRTWTFWGVRVGGGAHARKLNPGV